MRVGRVYTGRPPSGRRLPRNKTRTVTACASNPPGFSHRVGRWKTHPKSKRVLSFVPVVPTLLIVLVVMNLCAFLVFGWDKRRAVQEKSRVPEARLLLLAWLGGLVGAWSAMHLFRHKTRKTSFRWKMVCVTICNAAWPLIYWMLNDAE